MVDRKAVTVIVVGSISANTENVNLKFQQVAPTIKSADIALCQLGDFYSQHDVSVANVSHVRRDCRWNANTIANAGFSIATYAVNKNMEYLDPETFLETVDIIKKAGIKVVGVGNNIREARKPCIIQRKGIHILFLAYSSMLPDGCWLGPDRPGFVPMRGLEYVEQVETEFQPGVPAKAHFFANPNDKTALIEDVMSARARADLVFLSIDWGIHAKETEITMYQQEIGHAALDAGADAIFGYCARTLKPIEIYKGKPIFYGLPDFALGYPIPPESRKTMAVKITISDNKVIDRLSLLPAAINGNSEPRFVKEIDKEFHEVLAYIDRIGKAQHIDTRFTIVGNEVVVGAW
jgi:poly-gamma-glutamate capsule biosynthesis protein CapA/YwtB (metallophosphatase superfamily)